MAADEKLVEWMSTGQDATAPSYVDGKEVPPMVEVIHIPSNDIKSTDLIPMCERIRKVVSSGRSVALVPPSNEPMFEWTEECISQLAAGLAKGDGNNTLLVWQSKWKTSSCDKI